jgi:hypothetical protein
LLALFDNQCRERRAPGSAGKDRVPVPQPRSALGAGSCEGRQASTLCREIGWRRSRQNCGVDTALDGSGEIREPRLYQLVRQKDPIVDRTFEIEFLDPGVHALEFTFA